MRKFVPHLLPAALAACLLLTGCAARQEPLYYWGSYQGQVYEYLKKEKSPEDQIQALEADKEKAAAKGKPLPPGFMAHLGILYGQTGRLDRLEESLNAEKLAFPEGASYVDFLLKKKTAPKATP